MNEKIQIQLDKIPNIVECPVKMSGPNEPILLYEGDFMLVDESNAFNFTGQIVFQWIPKIQIKFTGVTKDSLVDPINLFKGDINRKYRLLINNQDYGKILLSNRVLKFDSASEVKVHGILVTQVKIGDLSAGAEKIIFAIPNLRDFYGEPVKYSEDNHVKINNGRLTLLNKDYIIYIDTCEKKENIKTELKEEGGYLISHSGEIRRLTGDITFSSGNEILDCLSLFLTFINGRATSVFFRKGIFGNNVIFEDNSPYKAELYKPVISWPQKFSVEGLTQAWDNFSEQYQNEDYKSIYKYAIHWYVEANALSASTEGSIILAQTALELMYNFIIVEKKKIVLGKDSQVISASNKIRLLLSQLSIEPSIPQNLTNLANLAAANSEISDGPEAITQIRNAIVHSQENKRKKLGTISGKSRYEALQLSIWYIELSLLYLIKHNGKYFNRTSGVAWEGDGEEFVPWVKKFI